MRYRLMQTNNDKVLTLIRLALGIMIVSHGAQKLFGWFGGFGLEGTLGYFASIGVPAAAAWLVIAAEFLGGLGLITGLLGRVAAAGVAAVMAGAVFLGGHINNGFFMNWTGGQSGEGWEFFLLATTMAVAIAVRGSGALSLDRALTASSRNRAQPLTIAEKDELRRAA
jgi:putative oxidoreductase